MYSESFISLISFKKVLESADIVLSMSLYLLRVIPKESVSEEYKNKLCI